MNDAPMSEDFWSPPVEWIGELKFWSGPPFTWQEAEIRPGDLFRATGVGTLDRVDG